MVGRGCALRREGETLKHPERQHKGEEGQSRQESQGLRFF